VLSSLQIATAVAGELYGFWLTSKSSCADTHVFFNKNFYVSIIIIIISSSSSSSSSIFIIIIIFSSIKDF
jgi:hypothetical protein